MESIYRGEETHPTRDVLQAMANRACSPDTNLAEGNPLQYNDRYRLYYYRLVKNRIRNKVVIVAKIYLYRH